MSSSSTGIDADLFRSLPPEAHPDFQRLQQEEHFSHQRERLNAMWGRFRPFADQQFPVEFPKKSFHSRFWELTLACELLDQGFPLVPRKQRPYAGPDFCITDESGTTTWIEAIAPTAGSGSDRVLTATESGTGFVPEDKIVLRYQSAVKDKHAALLTYLQQGIVSERDAYVIAIYSGGIPRAFVSLGVPYLAKAVYPIGHYAVTFDPHLDRVVDEAYEHRPFLQKASGAQVSSMTFLDPQFSGIAAVLSASSLWFETARPHLVMIHNHLARRPLPLGWLRRGTEHFAVDGHLERRHLGLDT